MRRGFTLIELLVVIAIIAILASILFPVFARAREKARQTSCLSHVKQLVTAMLSYAQDHDDVFPKAGQSTWRSPTVYWFDVLAPYCKNTQILLCPSALPLRPSRRHCYGWNVGTSDTAWTNGMGYWDSDGRPWLAMSDVPQPAETVMLSDLVSDCDVCLYFAVDSPRYLADFHNGGGNYGFLDGHAKFMSRGTAHGQRRLFTYQED